MFCTVKKQPSCTLKFWAYFFVICAVSNMFYALEKESNALVYSFANFRVDCPT